MQWLIDLVKDWVIAQNYLTTGFVDRGDPAAEDYAVGDFTKDATWRDLDLSGIVPAGAKAVLIKSFILAGAVHEFIIFREKGNANVVNVSTTETQVVGVVISNDHIVACDSNRVIQYNASAGAIIILNVSIKGWWL